MTKEDNPQKLVLSVRDKTWFGIGACTKLKSCDSLRGTSDGRPCRLTARESDCLCLWDHYFLGMLASEVICASIFLSVK